MNDLQIKILKAIENDSKISAKDLAIQLGAEEKEVTKHIKQMEKEGIILGYNTLIDWSKTERSKVTALIFVKVSPQKDDGFLKIAKKICKYKEVCDVTLVSGNYDFMVTVKSNTLQEVADFVHTKLAPIDGVTETNSNFILEKFKENGLDFMRKDFKERMVITP